MKWEEKRLDKLGVIIDSLHKTPKYSAIGFPMVRVTDIKGGYLKLENTFKVSEEVFQEFSLKHKSQKGDIVMSRVGTYGVPSLVDSDELFCLGQNTLFISNTTTPKFIFYSLQSPYVQAQIEAKSTGASQKTISLKSIRELAIPCPSLPIQQKIASILSAYDDLIENNLKRIRLLEEAAQNLYREWFVKFRFPGWEEVRMVDGLPEGWEKCSFYDVADILSGGTPKTDRKGFWEGEIPFFTAKDASSNGFLYINTTEKYITQEGLKSCNSKLYEKDTVFITARGTVGKICLPLVPMAMSQSCYALKGRNGMSQLFLCIALRNTVEQIKKMAIGGVFDTIIVDTFKKIPFVKPLQKLIADFEKVVAPVLNQTAILQQQNQKLKEARDLLLPRLMNQTIEI